MPTKTRPRLDQVQTGDIANLKTICRAAQDSALTVMRVKRVEGGEPVTLLCAINRDAEGGVTFTPLAEMFSKNPYKCYLPPA
jgi:hypothetical protein